MYNFTIESHARSILEGFYFHLQDTLAFSFIFFFRSLLSSDCLLTYMVWSFFFFFLVGVFIERLTLFLEQQICLSLQHVSYC